MTPRLIQFFKGFDPPRQRAGMQAILEHSIENYRPLPSCFRRHGRTRSHSRPTPYPLMSCTSHLSSIQPMSSVIDRSTFPGSKKASLIPHSLPQSMVQNVCAPNRTHCQGLDASEPFQGRHGKGLAKVNAPLQQVPINPNPNASDSSLNPKRRPSPFAVDPFESKQKPHFPGSAHPSSIRGLCKRQSIQSSTSCAKENVLSPGQDVSTCVPRAL
jgi:hypothetical protein